MKKLNLLLLGILFTGLIFSCATPKEEKNNKTAKNHSHQDTAIKTHTALCRCKQLSVTYTGTDPERITMCHCNSCQLRTGTAFSIQGRFTRSMVKIEGESKTWTYPNTEKTEYPSCDIGGATYHFCPTCGSTVYWDITGAPDVVGIAIGNFTDPTFPAPMISGFEKYGHPWAMHAEDLDIIRLELGK